MTTRIFNLFSITETAEKGTIFQYRIINSDTQKIAIYILVTFNAVLQVLVYPGILIFL